ncbi:SRPBCC family protein [Melissospora conviva]|uniref:SRPBCC family protein n=1 Tax=Melissospora conviva TaxID=3388432 RepID=UPI003B8105F6
MTQAQDLTVELSGDHEIVMSRAFDAPRELVFAVHTQPEHLAHWWGRGNPLDIEMDFRVGGTYRFVEHADGDAHGFRGEFREIDAPHRLVQTFEWEGMPGHIAVETHVFDERDGQTVVTTTTRFDTREDRDGMAQSGMEAGARQSYAALDTYLKTLI